LARRGTSPNLISLLGMAFGIAAGLSLAATASWPKWERTGWLAGAVLIQLRLLCNLLDGMVAIESGQASQLGELYNDVPDRVSDPAALIGAGYSAGGSVVLGYTAACVALFTAYVRATGKACGLPSEYCGPMAKQQRMAVLSIVALYCAVSPRSWQPVWCESFSWGLPAAGLLVIVVGGVITIVRRLGRISASLRQRGT
jgi:phosphatidylglycerophosphate synthase